MRLLFQMDKKNYNLNGSIYIRPSSRAIIIENNEIAMVHSDKYDYYKFPGGGIEKNETKIEALVRETMEESGLQIIEDSIKEYGYVHRIEKGDTTDVFIQDNYYYLCKASHKMYSPHLDDYEKEDKISLVFVNPSIAIIKNRSNKMPRDVTEFEREARVLELLIEEGYFQS